MPLNLIPFITKFAHLWVLCRELPGIKKHSWPGIVPVNSIAICAKFPSRGHCCAISGLQIWSGHFRHVRWKFCGALNTEHCFVVGAEESSYAHCSASSFAPFTADSLFISVFSSSISFFLSFFFLYFFCLATFGLSPSEWSRGWRSVRWRNIKFVNEINCPWI